MPSTKISGFDKTVLPVSSTTDRIDPAALLGAFDMMTEDSDIPASERFPGIVVHAWEMSGA
ncbi:hypothetical protein GCM10010909_00580 [Acidocella aquatica]|uniref:Uncharacterized protein n=1 Tax=Acidocella aquatica TaxID=1922313 RepID=A0ABQ5ZYT7_9PROT|nr:hypothetical protein GCM10010909_00580 [Acidocella aquatica]